MRLERLLQVDPTGNDLAAIDALVVTEEGIGVVRARGDSSRVLPWSSVIGHMVERWSGGPIPGWWLHPELDATAVRSSTDTPSDGRISLRALPHADPGAVIAIQSSEGTHRYLVRGGDARILSNRITDFAVRDRGLAGVPSVTTVARAQQGDERRVGSRAGEPRSRWRRLRPYLSLAVVLLVAVTITLILLQSAGTIHLPYLGGSSPGLPGAAGAPGHGRTW